MAKLAAAIVALLAGFVWAAGPRAVKVKMETNKGNIIIELDKKAAPKTVDNFLAYLNDDFYAGTIFHRVIKGFMIQGGGFTPDMVKKETKPSVENEAFNGLKNKRGAIAMARTSDPHSASSQFFINTVDNTMLDFKGKTQSGWGYCVFGRVTDGMAAVDAIESVQTGRKGPYGDVPLEPVIIKRITVLKEKAAGKPAANKPASKGSEKPAATKPIPESTTED